MRATGALERLRPQPHRGDQIAAGVVVLVTFIYVLETRFEHAWGPGIRLVIDAAATFLAGALAVQSPLEGERPRAYQSILYVATFFLALALLKNLADVLGANDPINAPGTIVWVGLALMALCIWFSARRNSAIMTLLGAITFAGVVEAFVDWVFSPNGASTFRWILLLLIAAFALASLNQRGPRPRHGVQLVNAAGLAAVLLGLTFALELIFSGFVGALGGAAFGTHHHGVGTGWELVLLACGFGLIAYAGVDREPGPAYLGVIVLALFVGIAGPRSASGASLIGWPIVLLAMAGAMLVVGLRPSRPLPPPPDAGAPPPPPPTPLAEPPTTPLGGEDPTEIR